MSGVEYQGQSLNRRAGSRSGRGLGLLAGAVVVVGAIAWFGFGSHGGAGGHAGPPAMPPAVVSVSEPLLRDVPVTRGFLGQFSAIDRVELRAQVGGTLTAIDFTDGQIVHKGDTLFVIDPRPYQIRLAEAQAALQTAAARTGLAQAELWRAQQLKQTDFGTAENVDVRDSDKRQALAAIDTAEATVRDAELDVEWTHVVAPFTGRISNHRVSVGDLISGSRAGTSATTLLTTLVSLDPIHLDFDMSENDFLAYQRARASSRSKGPEAVDISLGDENGFDRHGTLDFVDNAIDRSSGTIHARATVPNGNLFIVPGEFARVRLQFSPPRPTLLLPDSAVMIDQSQHIVMTVAPDGTVVPKPVETGDLHRGLRVITAGLAPTDRVIVDGLMHAMPGAKVVPKASVIHAIANDDGGN